MISSIKYERMIKGWSEADTQSMFNFTSGHIGAIPYDDAALSLWLESKGDRREFYIFFLLAGELIKVVVFTVFPIKSLLLYIRALARKFFNGKHDHSSKLTILSLGNQSKDKDAYFGELFNIIEEPLTYIKIVGGNVFRSKDYIFLESCLSEKYLFNLFLFTFLNHPFSFLYLIRSSRCISNINEKIIYILIGMKELNLGVVYNNLVITQSLYSYVNNVGKIRFIYPMEGRNWEKPLVNSLNSKLSEAIGYLHMALTPRHISLYKPGFYKTTEVPSTIIANSIMSFKLLKKNFPNAEVRKGYFLRGTKSASNFSEPQTNTLMFALTGNVNEARKILEALYFEGIHDRYNLIIRLNTNTSTCPLIRNLTVSMGFKIYNIDEPVLPNVCFYRSSSVALDYLKSGVLPVYLALDEVISHNTFELDNRYKFPAIQLNERFSESVDEVLKLSFTTYDFKEASNYYLDHKFHSSDLTLLIN